MGEKSRPATVVPGRRSMFLLAAALTSGLWILSAAHRPSSDVYYMIAQGRSILSEGLRGTCVSTWLGPRGVICQNWALCAVMALLDRLSPDYGAYFLYGPAMLWCLWLCMKDASETSGSSFAGSFVGVASLVMLGTWAWESPRPELITTALLLLECRALERHRWDGRLRHLAMALLTAVLEANLHGSMVLLHVCVLAAYTVPPIPRSGVRDTRAMGLRKAAPMWAAMLAACCANPWGAEMLMYVRRSSYVFSIVRVTEQDVLPAVSTQGVACVACILCTAWLLYKKKIGSSELWLCLGLTLLGMLKVHGAIGLPIVGLRLFACFTDGLGMQDGSVRIPRRDAVAMACVVLAVSAALAAMAVPDLGWQKYKVLKAGEYIRSVQESSDEPVRVVTEDAIGSLLEYAGVEGCFRDGRPEMLMQEVNGQADLLGDYLLFRDGTMTQEMYESYGSMDGYIDANNIRFVICMNSASTCSYLVGWIEASGRWRLVDELGLKGLNMWERID